MSNIVFISGSFRLNEIVLIENRTFQDLELKSMVAFADNGWLL